MEVFYTCITALCGGVFVSTSTRQTISSPGYPNPFRQDVSCRWTIDAPTSTDIVEVNVTAIDLQSTAGCSPEYLEIRDYPLVCDTLFLTAYQKLCLALYLTTKF